MVEISSTLLHSVGNSQDLLIVGPSLGTRVIDLWGRVAADLGRRVDGLEVVGWDLPGHGSSPAATTPFSVTDLAAALAALADQLAGGRRCWVAGVSLGGMVSLAAAITGPQFAGVIGLACDARIGSPIGWADRAATARTDGLASIAAASADRWFAADFVVDHPESVKSLLAGFTSVDAESYARCCLALAAADLDPHLPRITAPVLLAAGALDQVVPLAAVAATAKRLPRADLIVLERCAHQPPVEVPDVVTAVVARFVEEQR